MIVLSRRAAATTLAALAAVALGCAGGGDDGDVPDCDDSLIPGDLVLTEVMANPTGDDDGNEWFEVYNASTVPLDLAGVELVVRKLGSDEDEKVHAMGAITLMSSDYLVLGDVLPELKPAWVDYGYANALGSLVNGGGVLGLRCGATELDLFEYPEGPADGGASIILDGNISPDHLANDAPENLCASTVAFADAANVVGSPGESNEVCDVVVPGTCDDGAGARPVDSPEVGDLVITEFLANPSGSDGDKEWFEVLVNRTVDLNGVVAGLDPGAPKLVIDDAACVTAAAGSYLLFAKSDVAEENGGLPEVDRTFTFTMKNGTTSTGDGSLFVGLGEEVLDQVTYTASEEGAASALAPDQLDVVANDDPANFVACGASYGDGDHGTPGAANDACDVPEGQCDDGGTLRDAVAPGPGDLAIREALPNGFNAGIDPSQEWFEVEVLADVDLAGLEIGKVVDPYTVVESLGGASCRPVTTGTILLFAHEATGNGGLPEVDQTFDMALTDSNSAVFIGHGGVLIDALAWTTTRAGKARAENPAGGAVCDAEQAYGDAGNFGSPGDPNPGSTTTCASP